MDDGPLDRRCIVARRLRCTLSPAPCIREAASQVHVNVDVGVAGLWAVTRAVRAELRDVEKGLGLELSLLDLLMKLIDRVDGQRGHPGLEIDDERSLVGAVEGDEFLEGRVVLEDGDAGLSVPGDRRGLGPGHAGGNAAGESVVTLGDASQGHGLDTALDGQQGKVRVHQLTSDLNPEALRLPTNKAHVEVKVHQRITLVCGTGVGQRSTMTIPRPPPERKGTRSGVKPVVFTIA